MSAEVLAQPYLTVEEFLASEELGDVKCEYFGGVVHAVAGASDAHNRILINLTSAFHRRLRGRRCEAFGPEMKLRLQYLSSTNTYFYYPDAMVVCNPTDGGNGWREQPAALFEIISDSTRQIDEREKRAAYLTLSSLEFYVRIEQDRPEVVLERRTLEGWRSERIIGLDAVINLSKLEVELPLRELYERINFPPGTPT